MFWSKGPDKKPENKAPDGPPAAATNIEPRKDATDFDPDKLPERRQLPKGLQKIIEKSDKDESFFDDLKEG